MKKQFDCKSVHHLFRIYNLQLNAIQILRQVTENIKNEQI